MGVLETTKVRARRAPNAEAVRAELPLGRILAASDGVEGMVPADDRLAGSIASQVWCMHQGVAMVRAHDVRAAVQAARVVAA